MRKTKVRDGFEGQRQINLPGIIFKNTGVVNSIPNQIFITHIGYFPKAAHHFRERRKGCSDNIFIYCLNGKGWYIVDKKKYEVGPNQFLQIPATTKYLKYGADDEQPWTIFWVHYSGSNMDSFNKLMNISVDDGPKNIPYNEKGLTIWEEMYKSLEMGYSKDNLNNANMCLYYFLSTFLYPDRHFSVPDDKDMVRETIVFMRDSITSKFTVANFANRYQLSMSYFSSLFRKSTGMSPMEYFIQLKIQRACQLLFSPHVKIKDIAINLGYDDPYYFSRLFKKTMGVSPESYRMMNHGF
ncbi:AraC-type DNA-binding protein [Mucilaginibacter mallensis]|uniref:AraC-type DNA-binding protein n=1 Tax=Mucilaginibacter mallensis TaxID=652787 RepID=A0A1H1RIY6_MUCMA|nr:AraC family transcriptional regulator [Mucilaginibacter mallensis]SDS35691.1 AraC-type DNA-binding protein [Mucilaginibacter mallensis]